MARPYVQRARAEEAERTRLRVIEAVLERLREAPAEPVAIERIAEIAGVARSTIYAIFGSRAGLFDAVGRQLVAGADYERLLDAKHQPDAREHLRAGFIAATEMLASTRDVYRALHSMAQLDEDAVGGAVRRREEQRAAGMARLAGRLAEQGHLREGLDAADAEDILWVLTSFESFDSLYTGRGLATERVTELLIEMAELALYGAPYEPLSPTA